MTASECKPGLPVETQYGVGWLLHPDPRKPERWLVYRHPWQCSNHNVPTCEYWDASELRKADNVSDR